MMSDAAWYWTIRDAWWINEYHSNDGDGHDDDVVMTARNWCNTSVDDVDKYVDHANHLHDDHNHFGLWPCNSPLSESIENPQRWQEVWNVRSLPRK